MVWPTTSDGIRSGVNWRRLNSRLRLAATVLTSRVLATPGTPSRSTWPPTRRAAMTPDRAPSCPTTTLRTSSRMAVTASRGDSCTGTSRAGLLGGMRDLLVHGFDRLGQHDQLSVSCGLTLSKRSSYLIAVDPGASG